MITMFERRLIKLAKQLGADGPPAGIRPAIMALDTSPEAPVPVRTILRLTSEWISRLGRVWVEGPDRRADPARQHGVPDPA